MRLHIVWPLALLAVIACAVPTGTTPQTTPNASRAGADVSPAGVASTKPAAPDALASNTADTTSAGSKGQPVAGQPSPAPAPSVQPASPPTAAPTPRAVFNDKDADNVGGGFVPGRSDGDGQG
jgi:hypothetical protein